MAESIRELPHDEYDRLLTVGGPLHGHTFTPSPSMRIAVIEVDGEIVGYWPVFSAVHAEPLWIDAAFRGRPHLALALIQQVMAILREEHVQFVFGIIGDADVFANGPMAEKLGFAPIPGRLYGCHVPTESEG